MHRRAVDAVSIGHAFLLPVLATIFCWYLSPNEILLTQATLALLLLIIPWTSFLHWRRQKTRSFPLFTILAFGHWIYFVQPLFFGDRAVAGSRGEVSQELITLTLLMALIGVICLAFGMRTKIILWTPGRLPDISDSPLSWPYLRVVMAVGIVVSSRGGDPYAFGDGGRQVLILLQTVVPSTVFAFFFRKYVVGTAAPIDRILVFLFLGSRILVGLSSGWLGTLVWPAIICVLIYITEGKRVPISATAFVIGTVLFLQVGKTDFREMYWNRSIDSSTTERLWFWVDKSASRWSDALYGREGQTSTKLASETVGRLSLLTQAAHVIDWTPSVVPFQYGRTYSYLGVTLVPRFLWPNKPSMSEANQFYQVAYGLTNENELSKVSIAVGFLTEGYINFGWWGVGMSTFVVGVLLGIFQRTFLAADAPTLFRCMGLACIPGFMMLESQMAQYISGFIQQVSLTFLVLLPIIKTRAQLSFGRVTGSRSAYSPAR